MVGPLAESGAGLERLVWRDERSAEELRDAGLLAQPTGNAIHVGNAEVAVVQGNHLDHPRRGCARPRARARGPALPWRSWAQYEHRVRIAGEAYEANPGRRPSPNHHGMRDYHRLQDGLLKSYYAARHVTDDVDAAALHPRRLVARPRAAHGVSLAGPVQERLTPPAEAAQLMPPGPGLIARDVRTDVAERALSAARRTCALLQSTVQHQHQRIQDVELLAQRARTRTQRHARPEGRPVGRPCRRAARAARARLRR